MKNNKQYPPSALNEGFQLGEWHVYPPAGLFIRDELCIHAEPKLVDVLLCMAQAEHQVVSREQLLARVWPRVVVNDEVVTRAVSELRSLLGDTGKERHYIATVPKRGYKLLATVRTLTILERAGAMTTIAAVSTRAKAGESPDPGSTVSHAALPATFFHQTWNTLQRSASRSVLTTAYMLIGAAGFGIWSWLNDEVTHQPALAPAAEYKTSGELLPVMADGSVSITPQSRIYISSLETITDTPQTRRFANGLDDDLRHTLAQISNLQVVQGIGDAIPESDMVLMGSVRIYEQDVRVNLQLIDTTDAAVIWSKSYESDTGDNMALQTGISRLVNREFRMPALFSRKVGAGPQAASYS